MSIVKRKYTLTGENIYVELVTENPGGFGVPDFDSYLKDCQLNNRAVFLLDRSLCVQSIDEIECEHDVWIPNSAGSDFICAECGDYRKSFEEAAEIPKSVWTGLKKLVPAVLLLAFLHFDGEVHEPGHSHYGNHIPDYRSQEYRPLPDFHVGDPNSPVMRGLRRAVEQEQDRQRERTRELER